jgi:hypothetical protein
MVRRLSACALIIVATAGGCRMCQSYTDCAPVVPDGPYSHVSGRAGSILSGSPMALPDTAIEQAPPVEPQPAL